jgi:ribonuclease G
MIADVLIVRVRPGETKIARVDAHHHLKDFAVYRTAQSDGLGHVGGIYLGRVKKVVPALEAAFVDLGTERDGFLGLAEARPQPHMGGKSLGDRISDYVQEGDAILVQVLAAARDDKGPKITKRLSIAGAHCILNPGDPGVRLSKRIKDESERGRLRVMVSGKLSSDVGCIVRSCAIGMSEDNLVQEMALLRTLWDDLQNRAVQTTPPLFISDQETPVLQYLSEGGFSGLAKVVVDDPAMARIIEDELNALTKMPKGGVVRHTGGGDVFVDFAVADEVASVLDPVVRLKSGGSLVIEETAALTSIDINAGGAAVSQNSCRGHDLAMAVNIEAVWEAARQIRLRNLAGLIVLDLMPVRGAEGLGRIVGAMKDALVHDPAGPQVLGTTKGGLLEITRPRRRAPLSHILLGPCPECASGRAASPLTVGLHGLDRVLAEVWASPALIPALRVAPKVVTALKSEGQQALKEMEIKLGQPLKLIADESLLPSAVRIEAAER